MADPLGGEILRDLPLSAATVPVVHEIISHLGRHDDAVPLLAGEGLGDEFLAATVAVGVGRVEEVDPQVGGQTHEPDCLVIGVGAPPSGGDGPEPETDFTDLQV